MAKQRIKKPTVMRSLVDIPQTDKDVVKEMETSITNFVQNSDVKEGETVQTTTEMPIKPKVKMWVQQPNTLIDLHPSVSENILELDAEIEAFKKGIENNLYARKRAIKGVVKYYQVNAPTNLDGIGFLKTEDGTYQISVPQPDKLVEK
jgi:hypothetical protein